ncbi:kinesin-like protein KIF20B isoform X1, partial [Tachysurus ichikawai]
TVVEEECVSERLVNSNTLKTTGRTRSSVTSQGSCGSGPSVLDSSVISTETGRCSRFPRPELEISFSSLHPERFRLKRPGENGEVTVNVSHTHTRKRKSSEVERKRSSNRKSKARPTTAPQVPVWRLFKRLLGRFILMCTAALRLLHKLLRKKTHSFRLLISYTCSSGHCTV